jgi:UDP-glucuronate decarboxylase
VPGLAGALPARPGADDQDQRARRNQHARPGKRLRCPHPPGFDQRGLRRPDVQPQPESYWGNVNPIGIRSCYDEGKRCAETLFFDYHRQHWSGRHQVARIFNTYGPRMHPNDGRVVSNFIVRRCAGEPITIYGLGTQTAQLLLCRLTLIDGIHTASCRSSPGSTGAGQHRQPWTSSRSASSPRRCRLTGSSSRLTVLAAALGRPAAAPARLPASARELIGWQPKVQLEEGLMKTIAYFDKLLTETASG